MNAEVNNLKFLEENTGEYFQDLDEGKEFLNKSARIQLVEEKCINLTTLK